MNTDNQNLYAHLMSNRPSYLFLGQDYLRLETGIDALLANIVKKYGTSEATRSSASEFSYPALLENCSFEDQEYARNWISNIALRLVSPTWLDVVSNLPWSGVYSSSIDTLLVRAFRNSWRSVQPVFSKKFSQPDPRSRTNLHVTYLFGCIERENEEERSPLNEFDYIRRLPDSTILLSRLKEQTTPFGKIFIEGYRSERDWLTARDLATLALSMDADQIHLFSASEETKSDPMIIRLSKSSRIVLHDESLATFLNQGLTSGQINFEPRKEFRRDGHYITLGVTAVEIPENIWAITNKLATILDDSLFTSPKNLSDEWRYRAFKNFLFESGTRPVWEAYPLGFALERDFEKDLHNYVHNRFKRKSFGSDPIILHGQTGTGKSVALGALAYKIRLEKQYAVLFIERSPYGPIATDLDQFCKWAEDNGFSATLLVWDAMGQIEQYSTLQKYLSGRGRNVVIVGSSYKLDLTDADSESLIFAPPTLSEGESTRFKVLLSKFEPSLGEQLDNLLKKKDNTFLVALYRLLPDTRGQVKYGLQRETGAAEIALKEQASQISPEWTGGALLTAFQKIGFLNQNAFLSDRKKEIGGEIFSDTEELVGLIMVPGRFGLKVPIELVVRTLGSAKAANFHKIFESIDIFRWHSDDQGNLFIGTRHPLEAKLIAQARLGGPKQEGEFAKKLLIEISDSEDRFENTQIQFAADLLRNMGPNGPERKLYANSYEDIADCLLKLRLERGIANPRLMLQEASLLREAVVAIPVVGDEINRRLELLERAADTLRTALKEISANFKTRRLRAMLLVELASTLGTKVRELITNKTDSNSIMETFFEARRVAFEARTLQPEDFFPIDVISWSTKDLIQGAKIDEA
ncbi:MAG: hypothetical protein HYR68_08520, partial [Burkholderiales bacterium]|nr:hypothetical protein [Burkholderiales bacterium]